MLRFEVKVELGIMSSVQYIISLRWLSDIQNEMLSRHYEAIRGWCWEIKLLESSAYR